MKKEIKFMPGDFEKKYQAIWEKERVYQSDLSKARRPFYNLMMFPYPSAEGLHVGNMYAFTGADIFGRFKRMQGYDVFEPIGLDGFGIHSENYAIKVGKHPAEQAKISAKNFYRQLHAIGNGFAWENTLETYDPDYYKWTQWIFVKMFRKGLAYRKKSMVNFCPSCKTVLSDEQVIDGRCERCKSNVSKKEMEQWFFKITAYAEKLLQNTYHNSFAWSEKVKIGQRNWIGKKEGINIRYQIAGTRFSVECFTTRPDTNYGATFVVLAPEHEIVAMLLNPKSLPVRQAGEILNPKLKEIRDYVEKTKAKSEMDRIAEGREKTGVFTGFYAVNQLNNFKMPIYVTDFVLGHVGTGAVVGVPGHDKRDFEFARKFNLPVIRVVVGKDSDESGITKIGQVQEEEGRMVNSEFLDGKDIHEATRLMMDHLEKKGWGKRVITYKLRDWCISRQRYWGAPIPMIYCSHCAAEGKSWFTSKNKSSSSEFPISNFQFPNNFQNPKSKKENIDSINEMSGWYPVADKDLPVLLPPLSDWKPEGTGKGPLAKVKSFVETKCPKCQGKAERETDVCDTFLDSSWYHLRYPSVDDKQNPWNPEITKKWLPVTQYIGGAEHTVLHLLYARFIAMVFKDLGYLDFAEPYSRFYAHGLIIAEGAKMSKSRGNIVVPDLYINKYGADALRAYLMFLGPFDQGGDFRDTGIAGMHRFLGRVWRLVISVIQRDPSTPPQSGVAQDDTLRRVMHKSIKEVTEDLENFRYNTAIAHIMEFVNQMSDFRLQVSKEQIKTLLLLLAPFAPHMTEELYQLSVVSFQRSGEKKFRSIHLEKWPEFDPKYLVEDEVTVIVQVNGKLRDTLKIQSAKSKIQKEVEVMAKKSERLNPYIQGKTIKKTIFVPGKLINFVV